MNSLRCLLLLALAAPLAGAAEPAVVEDGSTVALEYTVTLEDGTVAQSNVGGEPIEFTAGENEMLPALEEALMGLAAGDRKQVTIASEDAYGEVQEHLIVEVPRSDIPEASRKEGAVMMATDLRGERRPVRVVEVKPAKVVLDYNHPLAGHDLRFDVHILEVR